MSILLLLFFIEIGWSALQGAVITFIAVAIAYYLAKSGLPQALMGSTQGLLKARTDERDDALKENVKLKAEIELMSNENKLLRREITQRYEIHHEDQATIRELKEKIWKLEK